MHYLIQKNLDKILHWNLALTGGFLGTYAILLHSGNFGSAQTGNVMEMAVDLTSLEFHELLLRLIAMVIFGAGVVFSYLLTNFTKLNMWKLTLLVDAAGLLIAGFLPSTVNPIVGLYPIFGCAAFQWGTYSGAGGYNSSTLFITNNYKQTLLAWTQYFITKDREFIRKGILYTFTLVAFAAGACFGCIAVYRFGRAASFAGLIPLLTARLFLAAGPLPAEDGTPAETEKEAEEELKEAALLEATEKEQQHH